MTSTADFVTHGLSSVQAASRLLSDGPNEIPSDGTRGIFHLVREIVEEPMLALIVAAGIINFVLAEPLDGVLLMSTIVVIISIEAYQERKTENALHALHRLASPRALVVRDGSRMRIPGSEVVRGDCLFLSEGDRVPADAVVIDTTNLSVDESALTGESVPVGKSPVPFDDGMCAGTPGGEGSAGVFSGTLVVRGQATAVVTATGLHTEIGRIGTAISSIGLDRTPMQREIDRLVRVIATVGLAAAAMVGVVYGMTRDEWLEGALAGIATAMSVIPEEFPVVMTVFLALGAWRMSRNRVLTRRPAVIEALGAASVICVDKTGTLTMNSMEVSELITDSGAHSVDTGPLPDGYSELAEFAVLASPVDPFDPMDRAFRDLEATHLTGTPHNHDGWTLVREYPLSHSLLALSHVWATPDGGHLVVAAKGAPEAIAELCRLDADAQSRLRGQVDDATARGLRVLGVAAAAVDRDGGLPDDQHDFGFRFLGLAGLRDPVRPGVADAVKECTGAGIRTVMITGDYPGTALAVAREIGLDSSAGCMTGPELAALTDDELALRVKDVNVFARMVPEQKLRLVRAFRADGEVVGMTGDGVNDAPALRAADVGIAMGGRGTDVAREAASLVITDDDYSSIVAGIRQGRAIYANMRKAMSYVIAVHTAVIGVSLLPLLDPDWPLVLLPLQIAFLELIIDPACSVVFEAEQADPDLMKKPPRAAGAAIVDRRTFAVAVLQGLAVLVACTAVYLVSGPGTTAPEEVRTATFATIVLANIGLILVNRSWTLPVWRVASERHNPMTRWIVGGALLLLAVVMFVGPARQAFHLGPPGWNGAITAVVASTLSVAWFEAYKLFTRR